MTKKVKKIQMDSRPMEDPKDPETCHLFQLYSLFADDAAKADLASTYRAGGFGYGDVKKSVAEAAEAYFAEPRQRREELAANPDRVAQILGDGAAVARKKAGEVLARAKSACGV